MSGRERFDYYDVGSGLLIGTEGESETPMGTVPATNLKTQGSIFGRMRDNAMCAVHKGIQDYLFEKIAEGDPAVMQAFERWTTLRPRDHFVHEGADRSGDP